MGLILVWYKGTDVSSSTLSMKVISYSETRVLIYKPTLYRIQRDRYFGSDSSGNIKSKKKYYHVIECGQREVLDL